MFDIEKILQLARYNKVKTYGQVIGGYETLVLACRKHGEFKKAKEITNDLEKLRRYMTENGIMKDAQI